MKFVGLQNAGYLLSKLVQDCLPDCEEVRAAIPYAEHGHQELLLFDDAYRLGKTITFYGRVDGTCPIDPKVLEWFLRRQMRTADIECRLVPHWLHAKVIWWVGVGAYIGSANLTDRAWNQNHEAGIFLTQGELDAQSMTQRLDAFFDQVDELSVPLDESLYQSQVELKKKLSDLRQKAYEVQRRFEDDQDALRDKSSPLVHRPARNSFAMRKKRFVEEWHETLAYLRPLAQRVAESRPDWVPEEVPAGVQCDQFLHAFYYNEVNPRSEKDAYLSFFEKNKARPEAAMQEALRKWKVSTSSTFQDELGMMTISAPLFKENFARDVILKLDKETFANTLAQSHAFGMHSTRKGVEELGFDKSPGAWPKILAHARMIYDARSESGSNTGPEVFRYVIWGPGDVAERIWNANHDPEYKLEGIGTSTLGEVVGWTRPNDYPPRNQRTNKAIKALGRKIKIAP